MGKGDDPAERTGDREIDTGVPSWLERVHPGQILASEFLEPSHTSATELANATGMAPEQLTRILHGTQGISVDDADRLADALGTTAQFWTNLQAQYEEGLRQHP
ncbi:HigA family addiction module antitoxin [Demequina sp. NBRC 110055]|uniref:HigA family addiction module antitoxin n=1 Tax=Demequina sp. NBRC 110055 TaxID=1570344 RepID=UPI000A073EC5|nr:HigA family addiction module antitoxin [Demequina sp. NBRC 110055]